MMIDTVCEGIIYQLLLASADGIAYMQELVPAVPGITVVDAFKKQFRLFLIGEKRLERVLQLSPFGGGIASVVVVDHHGTFAALNRVIGQQPAVMSIETKGVLPDFQHNQCPRPCIGADRQAIEIPSIRDRVVFADVILFTDSTGNRIG